VLYLTVLSLLCVCRLTTMQTARDNVNGMSAVFSLTGLCSLIANLAACSPCAGSGVVRIDPLRFLAGCHTRRLNQP